MTSAINRIRYVVLVLLSAIGININISSVPHAETFALLMGVSGYPSVKADLRLDGPKNDVILIKDRLLKLGIPSAHIRILADGVSGSNLPTRENILNELKILNQKAHNGDWVVIYWAGHGSIQPGKESNGFDEIFLPYDIGKWDGEVGSVKNAILDDEIGNILDEFSHHNIYVWAIFDTCHAGGMSRQDDCSDAGCPRERGVVSRILGIPQEEMNEIRRMNALRSANSNISIRPKKLASPQSKQIHFFAVEPHQKTQERKEDGKYYGVFTYHLEKALRYWDGDFKKLQKNIMDKYQNSTTTPAFQGSAPNFPVK